MPTETQVSPSNPAPTTTEPGARRSRVFDQISAARFLEEECGQKISPKTLQKRRCIGGGPPFYKGFGGRCYYTEDALCVWAESQRSPLVTSTSELAPKGRRARRRPTRVMITQPARN
jgi:hypothetical protein